MNVQFYCLLFLRRMLPIYTLRPRKYGSTVYF